MNKRRGSVRAKAGRGKSRQAKAKTPIQVKLGKQASVTQPNETFRVCPLGVQFYSPKKVEDFCVMDFKMQVAQADGSSADIKCAGVVVHSQKEKASGLYRVWVKFLDLPQDGSARLKCAAQDADAICPHCENF